MTANGIAVVPLNLPGVSRGKPLNKIGQRALNQGEIFFDNVKVPKEFFFITDPMMYRMIAEATLASANAGMGSVFTGLAAAAFDEALNYAKQRVQGGRPIIEHQSVKSRIFEMFELVEASRALSRRVVLYARAGMCRPSIIPSPPRSSAPRRHLKSPAWRCRFSAGMARPKSLSLRNFSAMHAPR